MGPKFACSAKITIGMFLYSPLRPNFFDFKHIISLQVGAYGISVTQCSLDEVHQLLGLEAGLG